MRKVLLLSCCLILGLIACTPQPTSYISGSTRYIDLTGSFMASLEAGGNIDNYSLLLNDFKDWGKTLVGGTTVDAPTRATVFTSITPNSSALRYCEIAPVLYGGQPATIDWNKKLIWIFSVVRINNDAEFVGRIQIKENIPLGQLAADGIGLQIDNFALTGETFGAGGRSTIDLTTVLVSSECYGIMIVHTPGVKDEFFVNSGTTWISRGSIVDPTLIPSGIAGDWNYIVVSAENGVTGGVNNELSLYKPYILSYR